MKRNPDRNLSLHVLQKISYILPQGGSKPNIEALSREFEEIFFFDSHQNSNEDKHPGYAALLAVGSLRKFQAATGENAFEKFQSFRDAKDTWLFGYLSYDLKNETESLSSANIDTVEFPVIQFCEPEVLIQMQEGRHLLFFDDASVSRERAEKVYALAFSPHAPEKGDTSVKNIQQRISKEEYIRSFSEIKKHILRGDVYELNFCQEFYAEHVKISPPAVFSKLSSAGEAPFTAFCRLGDHYILSSSPERFLKKQNTHLLSQPIKGTIRRSADRKEDESLRHQLRNDRKEQNENVMIVDLVRNDLSRIAKKGSVQVDELFGIYSFRQVHQMISTVSCELKENTNLTDILRATFPMGSMTGAPKVKAMQLIEHYEKTKRGAYSGALGYIDPSGNFDFSVVIRSILYNAGNGFLSFMTGSAITSKAEAELEYQECLLKAKAMFEVLS